MRLKRSREEGAMTPLGADLRSAPIPSTPHFGEVPCRP